MNALEEGWVEGLDPVCGEEQYTAIVFKVAQADKNTMMRTVSLRGYEEGTHNTATMALRASSFSERCSRKTSASSHCVNAEIHGMRLGHHTYTHAHLIYQNDGPPPCSDAEDAFQRIVNSIRFDA